MRKKVSLQEMKIRVKEFKEIVYSLRKANIIIYYKPELMNKIIFLGREKFEILLENLEAFEMNLIEDKKLEKFQHSLWEIKVENNKMILIAQNKYLKREVSLNINLKNNGKFMSIKKIL